MITASLIALLAAAVGAAIYHRHDARRGMRRAGEATNPHDSMQLRPHDH